MVWTVIRDMHGNETSGQILKGIRLMAPDRSRVMVEGEWVQLIGPTQFEVIRNSRRGIGKYEMFLRSPSGFECSVHNTDINVKKNQKYQPWVLIGDWHTPEAIAAMYGKKVDPDANKPRYMRKSFWAMDSKPGTFNERQKTRLLAEGFDPSKL